jgi:pilus assembly protein CpaE
MDVPNIRNLKSSLHTLETLGFKRDRLRIVLNRADSRVGLQPQEVEKAIGQKIEVRVPSSREVPLSVNRGVPLVLDAPESKVAAPLSALARAVGRTTAPAADKRDRFRLLRRFG